MRMSLRSTGATRTDGRQPLPTTACRCRPISRPTSAETTSGPGPAAFLGAFDAKFSLAPEEVQIAGSDWAFERGTYEITLTPKAGGQPMQDAGKYITVYRRQPDDIWAMARDIWNSSNPLPGMPGQGIVYPTAPRL